VTQPANAELPTPTGVGCSEWLGRVVMCVSSDVLRECSGAATNNHRDAAADKPADGNLACLDRASVTAIYVTGRATKKQNNANAS